MTSAPEVRTPRDLAELRTWLLDQWQYDKPFARYTRARGSSTCGMFEATSDVWERRTLAGAALYWVSEEMVDLLLATASSVPDDVMVNDLTPPAPRGLVVFAKPWYGTDSVDSGRPKIEVDAMLWGGSHLGSIPGEPKRASKKGFIAISTSMYRHIDFSKGISRVDLDLASASGAIKAHGITGEEIPYEVVDDSEVEKIEGYMDQHDGQDLFVAGVPSQGEHVIRATYRDGAVHTHLFHGHSWVPLGRSDWPTVDQITEAPWSMDDSMRLSFVEDRKVLTALWTLLQHEGVARQEIHHVERHAQKRAVRAGAAPEVAQKVQVVTLRKLHRNQVEHDPDHVPEKREWSHRWLVGAHYRWQACGKGRQERRLTFIAPYVKGPDDKPFEPPVRVNAWRR